jgi:arsenite methyltransferase
MNRSIDVLTDRDNIWQVLAYQGSEWLILGRNRSFSMEYDPGKEFNLDDPALISVLDELPFWSAPFGIRLLEKIVPRRYMSALDIGYGTGFPLTELAMRLGNTCSVYGIDPWNVAAERAREKIRAYGIGNCILLPVTAQNFAPPPAGPQNFVALPDRSIDLVVSNNGLNNVPDMGKTLVECARVLKPGGQLVFTMNLEGTMREFYEVMESVLLKNDLRDSIPRLKQHIHDKRRPLKEVRDLLEDKGFTIISVDQDQFSYSFSDGTTMFRHYFIRLAFLGPWMEIVPEELRKIVFDEIEDRINKISEEKGSFGLSIPFAVISAIL